MRQHLVRYLIEDRGVPVAFLAVEKSFRFGKYLRRADVVVHNRSLEPVLVAECKATSVPVSQASCDQVGRYNLVLQAGYILVTNGMEHYCCRVDIQHRKCTFLDEIPTFVRLIGD